MPENLGINKKIPIILVLLISSGLWFYSAFAQDVNSNSGLEESKFAVKINEFDKLLDIGIAAPLTALSLTGATFLTRISKNNNDDPTYAHLMEHTKKNLIKAFVIFLACTIVIFIFDFIELLLPAPLLIVEILDLAITYSLLFMGFAYLAVAAHKMYLTQAR
ncbi:hypothetical protein [Candidatus Nitrosotalea bavarica]|uniref:hypothetical protein n=1 Tax=Candidatus Nitrosotalea bavarica TaxID=1903277 RepID=UPI000C6FD567|nr:hypothetical protein [Candidatus Nitrosotalea bavarica]